MYTCTTRQIKITAVPFYLEEQSDPDAQHYVWAYAIRIENLGERVARLINRYWRITDAAGMVQEVRGAGVVGEQPVLHPGESYQYTSGASLRTPSGLMSGHYEMTAEDGETFPVEIPAFSLDSPAQVDRPN